MCCYCGGCRVDGWENQCVVIVVVVELMDGRINVLLL